MKHIKAENMEQEMKLLSDDELKNGIGGVGTGTGVIAPGAKVILTGTVYVDSYGSKSGRTFSNYHCRVVRIAATKGNYPILLGDDYSDQLGWVSEDEITVEN